MTRTERKYVLDANLFIHAFRNPDANLALQRFHALFAPFEFLSAVVAQELRAGVRTMSDRRTLEKHVLTPFARVGRIFAPSASAWDESGDVLSELTRKEGLESSRVTKAFGNDILLALSCRESGMVLITENTRDFERIALIAPFTFIAPWPVPVV